MRVIEAGATHAVAPTAWPGRGVAGQANSRRVVHGGWFTWFRRPASLGRLLDVEAWLVWAGVDPERRVLAGHERCVGDDA